MLSTAYARGAEDEFAARVLLEAETGTVLFESQPHLQRPPASMVKMMVVLLTMERVADGSLSLDDDVRASAWASSMGGSQVYLKEGEVFPLRDMLRAVVIASANDASVAVAEHIAGSTVAFVDLMNERAKELGLHDTVYRSVHGLPAKAAGDDDMTSAADLARLARELLKYDDVVAWASTPQALFRDGAFQLTNTNHLINRYAGANGMKTGYHGRAGFGVTATARRGDFALVAVVLACQNLQTFACDVALAGGATVFAPQDTGYLFEDGLILSPDGRCRPFDAAAQGTVPANGAGVVVLKRLADAVRDGDAVYAVIRGAAFNNDGAAKVGYTAPGVDGQAAVVTQAQALAMIELVATKLLPTLKRL